MDIKLDQQFQDKNDLFQKIFNSIAEGVIIADANGKFLFFNNVAEKILGIGMQKIEPEKWSDIYGCFYTDQITPFPSEQLPLAQSIKTGKVCTETVFIKNNLKRDGVFIDIISSPIKSSGGPIIGGIVVFKDVTENKKSEMYIRQSEERLKAQFKGIPIPTYVWKNVGEDFILIDYNDAAHEITGGKVKQLVDMKFSEMYPDNSNSIHDDFWNCFNNKNIVSREITHNLSSTGQNKELRVHYVYIPPDWVMVHTEDITERKNAEVRLQKLSRAVEQTADAVLITNNEGVIEYVNPAFVEMTGYQYQETIGQTPRILQSGKHEQTFYKDLWLTLLNGDPYKREMINKKKNGEYLWVYNTITPIKDINDSITNFVSVIKDITAIKEKKEQEIRLQVAREIQQRLYAKNIYLPGFDIAGKNFPAEETGGDYYDIVLTTEGVFWLVIADVSHHGIGPALIMAGTRAYLRAFLKTSDNPAEILGMLNDEIYADHDDFQYVTLLLVRFDRLKGQIIYSGAGHVPAYLLNTNGEVQHILKSTGIPLGFRKEERYQNSEIRDITAGNILVMLTDGIIEALDKSENEFGYERTLNIIKHHRTETSENIIGHIHNELEVFVEGSDHKDDVTALICKVQSVNDH